MESNNTIQEFIKRTEENLEFFTPLRPRNSTGRLVTHEVTQLVNSTVGILMFPAEEFLNNLQEKCLSIDGQAGINFPKILYSLRASDNSEPVTTNKQLIRYMRNAFAHHNIEFKNDNGEIKGIYFWNRLPRSEDGKVNWVAYISVRDLKDLLVWIASEFTEVTGTQTSKLDSLSNELHVKLRLLSREGKQ